jgi:hypothetical protein
MRVVTVHSRWKLAEAGMPVALRFDSWSGEAVAVEKWLRQNRGGQAWSYTRSNHKWMSHWSKPDRYGKRAYMIGLRDPEDVSVILLLKDTIMG